MNPKPSELNPIRPDETASGVHAIGSPRLTSLERRSLRKRLSRFLRRQVSAYRLNREERRRAAARIRCQRPWLARVLFSATTRAALPVLGLALASYDALANGPFVPGTNPLAAVVGARGTSQAFGDINGDGLLDVLVGDYNGTAQIRLFLNTGTKASPSFTLGTMPAGLPVTDGTGLQRVRIASIGDIDNDGDQDVVFSVGDFAVTDTPVKYYRNNGNNTFTDYSPAGLPGSTSAAFGNVGAGNLFGMLLLKDIDLDGDVDALLAQGKAGGIQYYRNDGTGAFTGTALPFTNFPTGIPYPLIDFADLDGDGDFDMIVGRFTGAALIPQYYRNDSGAFTAALVPTTVFAGSNFTFSPGKWLLPAFVDIDGDGDVDLFFGDYEGTGSVPIHYRQNDAPSVSSLAPGDNATEIPENQTFTITFSADVSIGTGDIVVRNGNDNATVATIPVGSVTNAGAQVSFPISGLQAGSAYYITWAATAFTRTSDSAAITGVSSTEFWNFTIAAVSNASPADIVLATSSIGESAATAGASVATMATTDADVGDTHTYSLAAGTGDTDNSSFAIDGGTLKIGGSTLSLGNYSVRIGTFDGTATYEEAFTVSVVDDTPPIVTSIVRKTPAQQTVLLNTVLFEVTFSEAVSQVTTNWFAVIPANGSSVTGAVTAVSGGPLVYEVAATVTGGEGDFRLEFGGPFVTPVTFATGFNQPVGLAFDSSGDLYVANYGGTTVSKVTSAGVASTFATGFSTPFHLAFDSTGNLYVANLGSSTVSKVTVAGVVSPFATGTAAATSLSLDAQGNLYVGSDAGTLEKKIFRVTPAGVVSTFATNVAAAFGSAFDRFGNLYLSDRDSNSVVKVTSDGVVSTFAAGFSFPVGLAFDSTGNLYVANFSSSAIRRITSGGTVSTFVTGAGGSTGLAFDSEGNLYLASLGGGTISKLATAPVRDLLGNRQNAPSYVSGQLYTYDPNDAPTDIALSNHSVNQSGGVNATVGALSTTDPDSGDSHTYSLASGTGDTDNNAFNISATTLRAGNPGSMAPGEYFIRLRVTDNGNETYEETFTIAVLPPGIIFDFTSNTTGATTPGALTSAIVTQTKSGETMTLDATDGFLVVPDEIAYYGADQPKLDGIFAAVDGSSGNIVTNIIITAGSGKVFDLRGFIVQDQTAVGVNLDLVTSKGAISFTVPPGGVDQQGFFDDSVLRGVTSVTIQTPTSDLFFISLDNVILDNIVIGNTSPTLSNLHGDSVAWAGVGNVVKLDSGNDATVSDLELGNDWSGAGLTVQRSGAAVSADNFGFDTSGAAFTVSGANLQNGGLTFATFTSSSGVLSLSFTSSATTATTTLVQDVIRQVTYRNDTPGGDATVRFTLSDGAASTTADVTVTSDTIYVTSTSDTSIFDPANGVSFSEAVAMANAKPASQTLILAGDFASGGTTLAGDLSITENLTLNVSVASGAFLSGSTLTLEAGTTLSLVNTNGMTPAIASTLSGSGNLAKAGSGTIALSSTDNEASMSGSMHISAGKIEITNDDNLSSESLTLDGGTLAVGASGIDVDNAIVLGAAGGTVDIVGGADVTLSGLVSGIGSLTKTGGGTLTLTHSGNSQLSTIIVNGTVNVSHPGHLGGSNPVTLSGGNLTVIAGSPYGNNLIVTSSGTLTCNSDLVWTGTISGSGVLTKAGAGRLTSTSTSNSGAPTALTVTGGSIFFDSPNQMVGGALVLNGGGLALEGSPNLGNAITLQAPATVTVGSSGTLSGVISGPGALTKAGNGNLTLSGNNSYSGLMAVTAGVLVVAHNNALGGTAVATSISSGATLRLNAGVTTAEPLMLSGDGVGNVGAIHAISGTATVSGTIFLFANASIGANSGATLILSGGFLLPANLTKRGSGTLVLSGNNSSYPGTVTVAAGTTAITGSVGGPVQVAAGATLSGTGTVGGSVTVSSGGQLMPGLSGPGRLTINGGLTISSGGTLAVNINGTTAGSSYDQVVVNGPVNISDATLSASLAYAPGMGDRYSIIDNDGSDSIVGTFSGLSQGSTITFGSVPFTTSYIAESGNDFALAAPTNSDPTDLSLSPAFINLSVMSAGATVGTLSTADADSGDSHTYSLVTGSGDADNNLFAIAGATLKVGGSALVAGSYSVRIQTSDGHGGVYIEAISVATVDDVAPSIVSIKRKTPAQQTVDTAAFTFEVTFSEDVTGVATSHFEIAPVNGASVIGTVDSVSGGPRVYDVAVGITGGTGEFRLGVAAQ